MNQGAPAAMNSCPPAVSVRNAPRSVSVRRSTWASTGSSASIRELVRRQSSSLRRAVTAAGPSSGRRCTLSCRSTAVGCISTTVVQLDRGAMTVRQTSEPVVTSGSPVAVIRSPRLPSAEVNTRPSGRASAWNAAPTGRPSLTANRSAKSAPRCTATVSAVASRPRLVRVRVSCSPSPTARSRTTRRVLSASPTAGGRRRTNRAAYASGVLTDSGCGASPSSRSSQRDRTRASRKNNPCEVPGTTSPVGLDRQNVVPSTTVTGPVSAALMGHLRGGPGCYGPMSIMRP